MTPPQLEFGCHGQSLSYKQQNDRQRRQALDEVAAISQELNLYD